MRKSKNICRRFICALLIGIVSASAFSFYSCTSEVEVGKLLSFCSGEREYELELSVGGYKYPMKLTLEEMRENGHRNGRVKLFGGVLDGVEFVMNDGNIIMKSGELELALDSRESPAMYALFGAFELDENDFVGVVSDKESGTYTARFDTGMVEEVTLDSESYSPLKLKLTDADKAEIEYDICFVTHMVRQ